MAQFLIFDREGRDFMGIAARTVRAVIRAYQLFLSYFFVGSCRYAPSCSEYAMDAVEAHGAARGGWLALRRICRCHPWGGSGYDPAPPAKSSLTDGPGALPR